MANAKFSRLGTFKWAPALLAALLVAMAFDGKTSALRPFLLVAAVLSAALFAFFVARIGRLSISPDGIDFKRNVGDAVHLDWAAIADVDYTGRSATLSSDYQLKSSVVFRTASGKLQKFDGVSPLGLGAAIWLIHRYQSTLTREDVEKLLQQSFSKDGKRAPKDYAHANAKREYFRDGKIVYEDVGFLLPAAQGSVYLPLTKPSAPMGVGHALAFGAGVVIHKFLRLNEGPEPETMPLAAFTHVLRESTVTPAKKDELIRDLAKQLGGSELSLSGAATTSNVEGMEQKVRPWAAKV